MSNKMPALTRRDTFALFSVAGLIGGVNTAEAHPANTEIDAALQKLFLLKRHAYQTGNAELLRSFYDKDIVIVGEGMHPLIGIEPVVNAYKALLPKRRDIETVMLRSGASPDGQMAWQFVRFTAFAKDPAENNPIATILFLFQRRDGKWRCIVESLLLQDLSLTPGFAVT